MQTFTLNGSQISIPKEIITYKNIVFESEKDCINIVRNYSVTGPVNQNIINLRFKSILSGIDASIANYIKKLSDLSVYNVTIDDFKKGNSGYDDLLDANNKFSKKELKVTEAYNKAAKSDINSAIDSAASKISGLGFGIISNDIGSLALYNVVSDLTISHQKQNAIQEVNNATQAINQKKNELIDIDMRSYFADVYLPTIFGALATCYSILVSKYVSILCANNLFDYSKIEHIDVSRSENILKNIYIVSDKYSLICNAIAICPYNVTSYICALENNCYTDELSKLVRYFGLKNEIEQLLIERININDFTDKPLDERIKKYNRQFSIIGDIDPKVCYDLKHDYIQARIKKIVAKLDIYENFSRKLMICDLHNIEKFIRDNMPDFDVKYVGSESYIKGYSEQKISSIISSNELQVITYKIKYTDFFNDIGKRYGFRCSNYQDIKNNFFYIIKRIVFRRSTLMERNKPTSRENIKSLIKNKLNDDNTSDILSC